MKILKIVASLENSSGVTSVVIDLAEGLASAGHDVSIFCLERKGFLTRKPENSKVKITIFKEASFLKSVRVSSDYILGLMREVSKYDVVHIHAVWNLPTFFAMFIAKLKGIPYVVSAHGSFDVWAEKKNYYLKKVYLALFEGPLINKAACIHALTQTERDDYRRQGFSVPVSVIPNGISQNLLGEQPIANTQDLNEELNSISAGSKDGIVTLLFLGRLHSKKGLDILIDALETLSEAYPGLQLKIAGSDQGSGYECLLRKKIEDNGLTLRCHFLGEVRGEAKYDLLRLADIFVLPSRSEGLPMSVLEAMLFKIPVLITRACNIPEVASYKAGVVVETSVCAVAEGLDALLSDRQRLITMGANGANLVKEKFSMRSVLRQYELMYCAVSESDVRE